MCVLKVLRTWKYLAKPIKMEECTPEFSRENPVVWHEKRGGCTHVSCSAHLPGVEFCSEDNGVCLQFVKIYLGPLVLYY